MMSVYWIRHKDHADIFNQGYVGVSVDAEKRFNQHLKRTQNAHLKNAIAKYGWDNLTKEVVLIADNKYCLEIEQKLRPTKEIGWNLVNGGGKPPVNRWNKGKKLSVKHCANLSISHTGITQSDATKQKRNEKLVGYKHKTVVCPHCNTAGGETTMKRWHFEKCKGAKIHRARVTINGKRVDLGRFDSKESVKIAINNFLKV